MSKNNPNKPFVDDITDDEIRVIGNYQPKTKKSKSIKTKRTKESKPFVDDISDDEIRVIGSCQPKDKWYKKLLSKGR